MSGWGEALDGQERYNLRAENKALKAELKALKAAGGGPKCTHEVFNEECEVCEARRELKEAKEELLNAKHYVSLLHGALEDLQDHYDWDADDKENVDAIKTAAEILEEEDTTVIVNDYREDIENNAQYMILAKVATGIRRLKHSSHASEHIAIEKAASQVGRWMQGEDEL